MVSISEEEGELGYDPRPELDLWLGTPIPPVCRPLKLTPQRAKIANCVWWNGPAWTVLRNRAYYLWHVMDHGRKTEIRHALGDIPAESWVWALDEASPGLLSRGSYILWSLAFDRISPGDRCSWPDTAHRRDWRPLAGESRERLYFRHRQCRGEKL
ncbi:MAG: hypothetical protein OXD01_09705 [Gammaproteobacteria bacterium]|nr:hypothetical protein [Gammaproteobacteria bacterium]